MRHAWKLLVAFVPAVAVAQEKAEPPPFDQQKIEQAQKALEAKKAQQPAREAGVTPTDDAGMRAEIMRLRRAVYALKQENEQLRSQMVTIAGDNRQEDAKRAVEEARAAAHRAELAERRANEVEYGDYQKDWGDEPYWWDRPGIILGSNVRPPVLPRATEQPIPRPGNANAPSPGGISNRPNPDGISNKPNPDGITNKPNPGGSSNRPNPDGNSNKPSPGGINNRPNPDGNSNKPSPGGNSNQPSNNGGNNNTGGNNNANDNNGARRR